MQEAKRTCLEIKVSSTVSSLNVFFLDSAETLEVEFYFLL